MGAVCVFYSLEFKCFTDQSKQPDKPQLRCTSITCKATISNFGIEVFSFHLFFESGSASFLNAAMKIRFQNGSFQSEWWRQQLTFDLWMCRTATFPLSFFFLGGWGIFLSEKGKCSIIAYPLSARVRVPIMRMIVCQEYNFFDYWNQDGNAFAFFNSYDGTAYFRRWNEAMLDHFHNLKGECFIPNLLKVKNGPHRWRIQEANKVKWIS